MNGSVYWHYIDHLLSCTRYCYWSATNREMLASKTEVCDAMISFALLFELFANGDSMLTIPCYSEARILITDDPDRVLCFFAVCCFCCFQACANETVLFSHRPLICSDY